jgi:hypothetical protein
VSWVFIVVVGLRLIIPLGIPSYPLPSILGSLVIDAADQTIFQTFGGLPNDYQAYDKALDVYYLVIAYSATMRNWTDPLAFQIGRFLWYYRLIGTVWFELSGADVLLLIFPNTFEYFFIAYEAIRMKWNPLRLSRRSLFALAGGIWIFVKLPQEWWIHVAHLDVTDEAEAHPGIAVFAAFVLVVLGFVAAARAKRLPDEDWPLTIRVAAHLPAIDLEEPSPVAIRSLPFASTVFEKMFLLGLISVIFAHVLDVSWSFSQVIAGVAVFVVVNAVISQYLARRGTHWRHTAGQFVAMAAINSGMVLTLLLVSSRLRAETKTQTVIFFVLLLSLLITLYDRYRSMRERRIDTKRARNQVVWKVAGAANVTAAGS